jgi:peroxiredoxin
VRRSLAQWRGTPVLLIFFDPACEFSRKFAPRIGQMMANRGPDRPLPVVVTTGRLQQNEAIFYEHPVRCPVLLQEQREVQAIYRVGGTPMGYLIDARGLIASPLAIGAEQLTALGNARVVFAPETPVIPGLPPRSEIPDFTLPDQNGTLRSFSSWRGRRTLLVFIDAEAPQSQRIVDPIAKLLSSRPGADPAVVMVASGSAVASQSMALHFNLNCPVLLQEKTEVAELCRLPGLPAAYLVDASGKTECPLGIGRIPGRIRENHSRWRNRLDGTEAGSARACVSASARHGR